MCSRCRAAYGEEKKCPFCKQPLAPATPTDTRKAGPAGSAVRARSEAALSAWREESSRALRASRAVDTSGRDEARRAFPAR